ncbi:hypothetical protein BDV25DRAFT_170424 [Aspergillus avenaceus]|uniref:Sld7 C-terminal domain-containing protein n=1 Tax=Aspergillus avenaceus TaxID=36643 RepID=A0A5N6TGU9_ASPAV|nr:hypothetical protein BDV25DRAFT_170424 [Aspergillus avenaceus]
MNIWSGVIVLDRQSQLQGLQLIDRSSNWHSDIPRDSTLGFRCFVNPAAIPLYARVGPNLELHTTDTETSQWLKHRVSGTFWPEEEDLDKFQVAQCPVGLLINVNSSTRPKAGSSTTDLLVYGVLTNATSFQRPPTPPVSSSASSGEPVAPVIKHELRLYATPISSSLIVKAQALPSPPNPGTSSEDGGLAQFLPDVRSPSPKRKRVATLFESVTQHHQRVRQKGGEAVSQMMANSLAQPSQLLQTLRIKRESEEPSLPMLERIASQRSRSLSIGPNLHPGKPSELRTDHSRPSSSRGYTRDHIKRGTPNPFIESSLRKENELSPALPSSDGGHQLLDAQRNTESIVLENKNTISRTILTCMRLYGYNRPATRPSSSKNSAAHDMLLSHSEERDTRITPATVPTTTTHLSTEEDEFKAMYHATYRASTFALRRYLKEPPASEGTAQLLPPLLDKGKAMSYIDEFLKLFCEEK